MVRDVLEYPAPPETPNNNDLYNRLKTLGKAYLWFNYPYHMAAYKLYKHYKESNRPSTDLVDPQELRKRRR